MSVDRIRAALGTIDTTPRDGFLGQLEEQLVATWADDAELDVDDELVGVGEVAPQPQPPRHRWMLMAASIVVLAVGLLVVAVVRDPDSVQTNTVPPTPSTTSGSSTSTDVATAETTTIPTAVFAGLGEADTPELFTKIAPGAMVDLPDAPIIARTLGAAVWSGTEMIVWSGVAYDPVTDSWPYLTDGAAFNLANGTWRVIAPGPLSGRQHPAAVWTGTEMIVWGGFIGEDVRAYDGAAYNPTTDTWRLLPEIPYNMTASINLSSMVWTGDEAVVLDGPVASAYDPLTNSWRRLANPPDFGYPAISTGDSIVAGFDKLMRYDVAADSWTIANGSYTELVAIPGDDGLASAFIALPAQIGAPVQILDGALTPIGELPPFPGDPSLFGATVGASARWVGEEVILSIWAGSFPYEPEQGWALNPTTQTWRQLDDALVEFMSVAEGLVVVGDVMLAWGDENGPGGEFGVAYRSGTSPPD